MGDGTNPVEAPQVSVVVPAYRRTALLREAIVSILAQDLPDDAFEIIVVDSSPDDENADMIAALQSEASCRLTLLRKTAEGPGPSRNLGAQHARAELIAFTDSDCQVDAGWLRHGIEAFTPDVGLVQGKTLPDPKGQLGVLTYYPLNEQEGFIYECTNIFYRKRAFEEAGGFPPDAQPNAVTPLGGEDVELAWSVKRNGWQSRFAAKSIVYHEVVKLSLWHWVRQRRLYLWPRLVARFPELRQYLLARYFWDRAQLLLLIGLLGVALATLSPWALMLFLPYALYRGHPSSKSFPGILRPLRILPYLARDTVSMFILLAGSLRYRSLIL